MIVTNIRKNAREALKGKWSIASIIMFITMLIGIIVNVVVYKFQEQEVLINIIAGIYVFISIPLNVGVIYSFLKLKRNEEVKLFDFLKLTGENFAKSWAIAWMVILKMILPIICVIVAITLYAIMMFTSFKAGFGLILLGVFVVLIAIFYAVVRGLLYILAYYVAYDHPEMSIGEAVNESARLMNGHRGDYFVLVLSFLGWGILAVLSLGIGYIWLTPYIQTALICFYDEIVEKDKGNAKSKKTVKE